MVEKQPFMTKRQLIMGLILGIFAFSLNLVFIYYDDEIKFQCEGYKELHYKINLSQDETICGNYNPFIYNNNLGFGVYLPNEKTKNYIKEKSIQKLNINLSNYN